MKVIALTIFPEIFESFLRTSLIAKAHERGALEVTVSDIRDFADPPHYSVDDSPYGGGAGMVMMPEPISRAITSAKALCDGATVVALTPTGRPFTQKIAHELSKKPGLILLCGRYEGIDQRVLDRHVDMELSIGDFILMGGEVPAMAIIEATARLLDNVVGNSESIATESFEESPDGCLLEAPHYTRPADFEGAAVPQALLSGNHAKIAAWRREQSLARTAARRPDLLTQKR